MSNIKKIVCMLSIAFVMFFSAAYSLIAMEPEEHSLSDESSISEGVWNDRLNALWKLLPQLVKTPSKYDIEQHINTWVTGAIRSAINEEKKLQDLTNAMQKQYLEKSISVKEETLINDIINTFELKLKRKKELLEQEEVKVARQKERFKELLLEKNKSFFTGINSDWKEKIIASAKELKQLKPSLVESIKKHIRRSIDQYNDSLGSFYSYAYSIPKIQVEDIINRIAPKSEEYKKAEIALSVSLEQVNQPGFKSPYWINNTANTIFNLIMLDKTQEKSVMSQVNEALENYPTAKKQVIKKLDEIKNAAPKEQMSLAQELDLPKIKFESSSKPAGSSDVFETQLKKLEELKPQLAEVTKQLQAIEHQSLPAKSLQSRPQQPSTDQKNAPEQQPLPMGEQEKLQRRGGIPRLAPFNPENGYPLISGHREKNNLAEPIKSENTPLPIVPEQRKITNQQQTDIIGKGQPEIANIHSDIKEDIARNKQALEDQEYKRRKELQQRQIRGIYNRKRKALEKSKKPSVLTSDISLY